MSVYVGPLFEHPQYEFEVCCLYADSQAELRSFAARLGLSTRVIDWGSQIANGGIWADSHVPNIHISEVLRDEALHLGAIWHTAEASAAFIRKASGAGV